jgi:2-phospho-L-lactate guanylyltransferase
VTGWQALVPIKQGSSGKSRLSGVLDEAERLSLVYAMAARVLEALAKCKPIDRITILSPECPDWWHGAWLEDHHRGLNFEIEAWRASLPAADALVVHADLPLVSADDLEALLQLADGHGATMATDRAGQGTNALALRHAEPFRFSFGENSRLHHVAQLPDMPVLHRLGLIADLDTPADLDFVQARGFRVRQACQWEGPMPPGERHNHRDKFGGECVR